MLKSWEQCVDDPTLESERRCFNGAGHRLAERLLEVPAWLSVVITVDRHANTSAASVPLALAEARNDGRIRDGDLVLMEALGGGLAWGSALVRL